MAATKNDVEEQVCFFCLEPQNQTSLPLRRYDKNCQKHLVHAGCAAHWIKSTGGETCPICRLEVYESTKRVIDLIATGQFFNCIFCNEAIGAHLSTTFTFGCCGLFEKCRCINCTRCISSRVMHIKCCRRWLEHEDLRSPHCGHLNAEHPHRTSEFFSMIIRDKSDSFEDILRDDIPPDYYELPVFNKKFDLLVGPTTFVWNTKYDGGIKLLRFFDENEVLIQCFERFTIIKNKYYLGGSWRVKPPIDLYRRLQIYIANGLDKNCEIFKNTELGFFLRGDVILSEPFYGVSPGRFTTAKLLEYFSNVVI